MQLVSLYTPEHIRKLRVFRPATMKSYNCFSKCKLQIQQEGRSLWIFFTGTGLMDILKVLFFKNYKYPFTKDMLIDGNILGVCWTSYARSIYVPYLGGNKDNRTNEFNVAFINQLTDFLPLLSFYNPYENIRKVLFSDIFKKHRKRPVA